MNSFLTSDFLLSNETARKLYHDHGAKMPIIDYHCHIDPKDIWEDRRFSNLTELWLGGDHYKWRLMRSNGVPERFITGDAPDREKFQKFAETLPRCIGNPMYHWCHLELKAYFGYEGILNGKTAEMVWNLACEKLASADFSARKLIEMSNVYMVGTTDDPCSDLQYHKRLRDSDFSVKVCPNFRPDPALNIHKDGFAAYIQKLAETSNRDITSAADVCAALRSRMEFFNTQGCRAADHGLDYVMFRPADEKNVNAAFCKAMNGETVTKEEQEAYQTYVLLFCGKAYAELGWVMQIHFGCFRNPNAKHLAELGPDTGFDCMAPTNSAAALHGLMNAWDSEDALPKTILYSLNPADDQWIDTLLGAYQDDSVPGKIQHGAAWWFNDNKTGMVNQLTSLGNLGILGNFVGMLTDSRSLLSYTRHEYFRRILCNLIGTWVENGEYPADEETLGALIEDICFDNAKRYFDL